MTTPTEQDLNKASGIVAKLEHGDEGHRLWLRECATALIATALAEERAITLKHLDSQVRELAEALKKNCWCGSLEPGNNCDGCVALKKCGLGTT